MKKPKIEVRPVEGFEKMGVHVFVNDRALDIPSLGKNYSEMIDALIEVFETQKKYYGNATMLHLEMSSVVKKVEQSLKKAGYEL